MRNELLNELKLEDLQGEARELAETIGMDAFRRLVDVYGGTGRVYIPQADKLLIPIRDRLILDDLPYICVAQIPLFAQRIDV